MLRDFLENGNIRNSVNFPEAVLPRTTIFHGLQYLAIVTIFHVRERKERERASGVTGAAWWRPAAAFYAVCVAAGYLLFQAWPHASALAGFSFAQSLLVMVAIINIHHFIVDAFIWRLRRDPNYAVVTSAPARAEGPHREARLLNQQLG